MLPWNGEGPFHGSYLLIGQSPLRGSDGILLTRLVDKSSNQNRDGKDAAILGKAANLLGRQGFVMASLPDGGQVVFASSFFRSSLPS